MGNPDGDIVNLFARLPIQMAEQCPESEIQTATILLLEIY